MNKEEKIRAEVERRYNYHKDHADDYAGTEHFWKADEDRGLLSFIDSMQEEPKSFDEAIQEGDDVRYNEDLGCRVNLSRLKRIAKKEATGKLKECIDNITDESLAKARKQLQEELVNGGLDLGCGVIWKDEESVSEEQVKELLISKHKNKTCKENGNSLTQELVSEYLEKAIDTYLATYFGGKKEKQEWPFLKKMAIHFANWQKQKNESKVLTEEQCRKICDDAFELGKDAMKQQMMANAVDIEVKVDAGGYPYVPQMELYNYDKDIPLAKEGDKYKVILIKKD